MGTVRLGVFPSIQNKIAQDDIAIDICNFFMEKFPVGFFHHVYIDTQTGNANQYLVNDDGQFMKYRQGQKIDNPHIRFNIRQTKNNIEDVFGSFWNTNQQPGAFSIDTDLTGYKPVLYDPYGIIIATNDFPVKNTFEAVIEVNSKADQLAIMNILDTNIKRMYGYEVMTDCDIVIPELMMEYIRSCVFKQEIDILNKMKNKNEEKVKYMQEINKKFMEYLYKYSNKCIVPYRMRDPSNEQAGVVFAMKRKQRVYLKLEPYEDQDGNKSGGVYTSFKVSVSGTFEYANIINFITSVPSIIRGTKNSWFIRTSENKTRNNYYKSIKFKEVFTDMRCRVYVNKKKYSHFYLEKELLMSSTTENFNILDDIIDKNESPNYYSVMRALLSFITNKADFDTLFKVIIYKGNEPIDSTDFDIDYKFNFTIRNCDLTVPYYIDIFVNTDYYNQLNEKIIDKLNRMGIDWEVVNENKSKFNILSDQDNSSLTDNKYILIKKSQYLVPKTGVTYYSCVDDVYIKLDSISKFKDRVSYFVLNTDETTYTEISTSDYLVPDPNIKFYIKSTVEGVSTYTVQTNLTAFDSNTEYYINSDENSIGSIVSVAEEQ